MVCAGRANALAGGGRAIHLRGMRGDLTVRSWFAHEMPGALGARMRWARRQKRFACAAREGLDGSLMVCAGDARRENALSAAAEQFAGTAREGLDGSLMVCAGRAVQDVDAPEKSA